MPKDNEYRIWFRCECNKRLCIGSHNESVTCPKCQIQWYVRTMRINLRGEKIGAWHMPTKDKGIEA